MGVSIINLGARCGTRVQFLAEPIWETSFFKELNERSTVSVCHFRLLYRVDNLYTWWFSNFVISPSTISVAQRFPCARWIRRSPGSIPGCINLGNYFNLSRGSNYLKLGHGVNFAVLRYQMGSSGTGTSLVWNQLVVVCFFLTLLSQLVVVWLSITILQLFI